MQGLKALHYCLQFLIESCLAARLKIADDNSQLSYIFDKFLKMLFKIVKLLGHAETKYNYTWRRNYNKTLTKMAWELPGGSLSDSECTSQSKTGTVCCPGNGNGVNVKCDELLKNVVGKKKNKQTLISERKVFIYSVFFYYYFSVNHFLIAQNIILECL